MTIFPNAVLYENTQVGPRCVIHASAVLGAYGFGYGFVDGRHVLSAQLGNVVLGADVEIGAGTTIDRGTYGPTMHRRGHEDRRPGDGRPQLPHRPAQHALLAGGHRRQHDHRRLRRDGRAGGRPRSRPHRRPGRARREAGIINDVPDGVRMIGIPATPEREQKIKQAAFSKLPEMRRQLKQLQRAVDTLLKESPEAGKLAIKADDPPDDENAEGRAPWRKKNPRSHAPRGNALAGRSASRTEPSENRLPAE